MTMITHESFPDFNFYLFPFDQELDFQQELQSFEAQAQQENHPAIEQNADDEFVDEEEESREPVDKSERRRLLNAESARRSRARTKEKLSRLEQFESAISQFTPLVKELLRTNAKPDLVNDLKSLKDLCKKNSPDAIELIQSLFTKTLEENTILQARLNEAHSTSLLSDNDKTTPERQVESPVGSTSLLTQEEKIQTIAASFFSNPTAKNGCILLKKYIAAKDYANAFILSQILIEQLLHNQFKGRGQRALLELFSTLLTIKVDDLTKPFYGWILFILTWSQAKKGTAIEKTLLEYEQAASFGCSLASYYKAASLQDAGREDDAIKEWERCIEEFAHDACSKDAAEQLVELLEAKEVKTPQQRNHIIELYKKADSANSFYNLGFIFQKGWASTSQELGLSFDESLVDLALAESYFKKSQELAPEETTTIIAIAETILADKARLTEERRQEALSLYQKAIDQGSKEAIYLQALAYLEQNNTNAAIVELQKLDTHVTSESDKPIHRDAMRKLATLYTTSDAQRYYLQRAEYFT